ncbi:MAG: CHASE2 domain-containing protein [Cyanobacteria bacterium J06633_2]
MESRVVFNLGEGTCQTGLANVVVQVSQDGVADWLIQLSGELSPVPHLEQTFQQWRSHYHALHSRLRSPYRGFEFDENTPTNVSVDTFEVLCIKLQREINDWLAELTDIEKQLRTQLSATDQIRVIIETNDPILQSLPWHVWNFFDDYPKAEVALSKREHRPVTVLSEGPDRGNSNIVRILAVLGCSHNIDVQQDRTLLKRIPQAEVVVLEEPPRAELNKQLWDERGWDILFFAGHSLGQSEDLSGQLVINSTERIKVVHLKAALKQAIARGMTLAIFNSCDGLSLGRDLADLNIPQLIVMREPIADQVAQAFLKYFLQAFSTGQSLYASVRQAREQLQGLEGQFPGASWLPVIFQNPAEHSMQWSASSKADDKRIDYEEITEPTDSRKKKPSWTLRKGLWVSLISTGAVMGIRLLGLLEPFELAAYDQLMRSRPKTWEDPIDPHLLVVEVTTEDTGKYGYPLDDDLLATALETLYQHQPAAVGIDMHRGQARGQGRDQLINLFNNHPNLFTVCAFGQGALPLLAPPKEFSSDQQVNQVGFSDIQTDAAEGELDRPVRRHLLTYDPGVTSTSSDCTTPYSFSFHLAYAFLDSQNVDLTITDAGDWQFGDVVFQNLPNRTGGYTHLGGQSNQILLNYRFNKKPARHFTLTQLLEDCIDPELIANRVVLVGTTSEFVRDEFETPHGTMSGVWVHAHMVSQMVQAVMNERSLLRVLPQFGWLQWGDFFVVWLGATLSAIAAMCFRSRWMLLLSGGVIILVMYYTCLLILSQGVWLPLVPTVLAVLIAIGAIGFYVRPNIH